MKSGCLLIAKSNFVCSGYQCEWKKEQKKPYGQRKTLKEIFISRGEIVILLSPVETCQYFKIYGLEVETQMVTFLHKRNICFLSTTESVAEYFSALTTKETYDKYRNS